MTAPQQRRRSSTPVLRRRSSAVLLSLALDAAIAVNSVAEAADASSPPEQPSRRHGGLRAVATTGKAPTENNDGPTIDAEYVPDFDENDYYQVSRALFVDDDFEDGDLDDNIDGWDVFHRRDEAAALRHQKAAPTEEAPQEVPQDAVASVAAEEEEEEEEAAPAAAEEASIEDIIETRIVGGNKAAPNSYPSFASLRGCNRRDSRADWDCCDGSESQYCWAGCAATMVSAKHAVTAAHCVEGLDDGTLDLKGLRIAAECRGDDPCGHLSRFVEIASVRVHPNYNRGGWVTNDIAILELTDEVNTAEIPYAWPDTGYALQEMFDMYEDGTDGMPDLRAVGMGKTSGRSGFFGGRPSKTLLEAKMFGLPEEFCEGEYGDRYDGIYNGSPYGSMMCAGQYESNQKETSTCGGDSGGPLYSADPDVNDLLLDGVKPPGQDVKMLMGITSWGRKSCEGGVENPSVFTRVGTVIDWFGPEVCSSFQKGSDRPGWCNACHRSGSNKPGWCGKVVPPVDAGAPSTITSTSTSTSSTSTSTSTTTTTSEVNKIDDSPSAPAWDSPSKPTTSTSSTTPAPAVVSSSTTTTSTVDDEVTLYTECQRERTVQYCGADKDLCRCGFINTLTRKQRKGVCGNRGSQNYNACPLACEGLCIDPAVASQQQQSTKKKRRKGKL